MLLLQGCRISIALLAGKVIDDLCSFVVSMRLANVYRT